MAGWEIALVMIAATYMVVNTVALIVQVKLISKWDGVFSKSIKIINKMMDQSEKMIDQMFEEDEEL